METVPGKEDFQCQECDHIATAINPDTGGSGCCVGCWLEGHYDVEVAWIMWDAMQMFGCEVGEK